jgi:hypothetical protein
LFAFVCIRSPRCQGPRQAAKAGNANCKSDILWRRHRILFLSSLQADSPASVPTATQDHRRIAYWV